MGVTYSEMSGSVRSCHRHAPCGWPESPTSGHADRL